MDVFMVWQLSAGDFWVRTVGRKQQHYKKLQQIRYFNFISIAECWCEIGFTSESFDINQSWRNAISRCYLVHGQLAMSLRHVKMSVICKCHCFCLFNIQQWSVLSPSQKFSLEEIQLIFNCYVSILNFHWPKY